MKNEKNIFLEMDLPRHYSFRGGEISLDRIISFINREEKEIVLGECRLEDQSRPVSFSSKWKRVYIYHCREGECALRIKFNSRFKITLRVHPGDVLLFPRLLKKGEGVTLLGSGLICKKTSFLEEEEEYLLLEDEKKGIFYQLEEIYFRSKVITKLVEWDASERDSDEVGKKFHHLSLPSKFSISQFRNLFLWIGFLISKSEASLNEKLYIPPEFLELGRYLLLDIGEVITFRTWEITARKEQESIV